MLDTSVLSDYLIELDFFDRSFLEQRVRKYGVTDVLKAQFEALDCSKKTSRGETVQQTNGYAYRHEISQTVELIKNYCENKSEMFDRLLALHALNLRWEVDNPPTPAKYKRVKGEKAPREKKESSAALKAKAKAAKIGKLSLNIKIEK